MKTFLATICHDPEGRLLTQLQRVLPDILDIFEGIVVNASHRASPLLVGYLQKYSLAMERQLPGEDWRRLGLARRRVVEMALEADADRILYCDLDRVLHWVECYPDELRDVKRNLTAYDFTVLGRTRRAFDSHPAVQRYTEAIINHVFAMVSGKQWDTTAGARGFSRRAAESIIAGCPDEEISVDNTWALHIQQNTDFSIGYRETEGLEFETADRFEAEIAQAGGLDQWMAQLDSDPAQWAQRLELARIEVAGIVPYARKE